MSKPEQLKTVLAFLELERLNYSHMNNPGFPLETLDQMIDMLTRVLYEPEEKAA
jgi:hypothetical protein